MNENRTRKIRGQQEAGVTAVMTILLAVVMLGITAFSVDIGNAMQTQRRSQSTADAAAFAGVQTFQDSMKVNNTDAWTRRDLAIRAALKKAKQVAERNNPGVDFSPGRCGTVPAPAGTIAWEVRQEFGTCFSIDTGSAIEPARLRVEVPVKTSTIFGNVLGSGGAVSAEASAVIIGLDNGVSVDEAAGITTGGTTTGGVTTGGTTVAGVTTGGTTTGGVTTGGVTVTGGVTITGGTTTGGVTTGGTTTGGVTTGGTTVAGVTTGGTTTGGVTTGGVTVGGVTTGGTITGGTTTTTTTVAGGGTTTTTVASAAGGATTTTIAAGTAASVTTTTISPGCVRFADDDNDDGFHDDDHNHDGFHDDDVNHDGLHDHGDNDHDGFYDDDHDHNGFRDDDHNHDGYHDDDNNHDGYHDDDIDHDGYHQDDHNHDGYHDDDNDHDGHHDGDDDEDGEDDGEEFHHPQTSNRPGCGSTTQSASTTSCVLSHDSDHDGHEDDDEDEHGHHYSYDNDDSNHDGYHDDDHDHNGYHDDDANHDGCHDDDRDHDGYHDEDHDHDGYHDDDHDHDGWHDDDANHDGCHDDDANHDGYHDDDLNHDGYHDDDHDHDGHHDVAPVVTTTTQAPIAASTVGPCASGNMLTNGSFESNLDGWTGSNSPSTSENYARIGQKLAKVNSVGSIFQTVNATAGTQYEASFYGGVNNPANDAQIAMQFLDSAGNVVLASVSTNVDTDVDLTPGLVGGPFRKKLTAPLGTAKVRLLASVTTGDKIYIDGASIVACPSTIVVTTTTPGVAPTTTTIPPSGVLGGHFDVDVYSKATTDYSRISHAHPYDDDYDVTGVNFLNPSDPAFKLANAIPDASKNFKILVANQYLSPASQLSIGGAPSVAVKDYGILASSIDPAAVLTSLPTYNRSTIGSLQWNLPTDGFTAKNWWGDGVLRAGLIPTQTACVNSITDSEKGTTGGLAGAGGERFNGALTITLIKASTPAGALELSNAAGGAKYGWRVKQGAFKDNVLAEYTMFWHHANNAPVVCYGQTGWLPNPMLDPTPGIKSKTAAVGSTDPKSVSVPS
jgi:Putative Flp pilus-assembly TadE/G-like